MRFGIWWEITLSTHDSSIANNVCAGKAPASPKRVDRAPWSLSLGSPEWWQFLATSQARSRILSLTWRRGDCIHYFMSQDPFAFWLYYALVSPQEHNLSVSFESFFTLAGLSPSPPRGASLQALTSLPVLQQRRHRQCWLFLRSARRRFLPCVPKYGHKWNTVSPCGPSKMQLILAQNDVISAASPPHSFQRETFESLFPFIGAKGRLLCPNFLPLS